ncbi:MAG TPA: tape measure protein [Spirochaetota bacterium]|nr:tape measure protein [Spirochaetota bacterium]
MSTQPGKIAVELSLMLDQFNKAILDANAKLTGMGKQFDQVAERMSRTAEGLGNAGRNLSTFLTLPILGIGAAAIKTAADMEMMQAQFTTLLGDGSRAKEMLNQIQQLGAKTPFETQDIAAASKTLLGFSVAADEVIDVVKMLGDTAQGDGQKLQSIALAYGQVTAQGKGDRRDMLQLINAGVPIFQQLELSTGRATAELMEMTERGEITGEVLKAAFQKMTSEGGLFYKGMETASETTTGKWSTLIDTVKQLAVSFGQLFIPAVKGAIETITGWLEAINSLSDGTKNMIAGVALVVAAIGPLLMVAGKLIAAYRAFIIIQAALSAGWAGQAIAGGASTAAFVANQVALIAASVATKAATAAQWLLNAALTANPVGIVIVAVGALVAAIIWMVKNWDKVIAKIKEAWEWVKNFFSGTKAEAATAADGIKKVTDETNKASQAAENAARKDSQRMEKRKQEIEKWVQAYKKAQADIIKLLEEHGKNEQQLEEMRHARAQSELFAQFKARQLTEAQYLKGSEVLRQQHEKNVTDMMRAEEEKRRQMREQALNRLGGFVNDLGGLLQMNANNRIAEIENEQTRRMEQIRVQYEEEKTLIESTVTNKKDRDAALKTLDEKRARQEKAFSEKSEKEKRKIQREAAKQHQAIAIVDTTITTAQAATSAWWWGFRLPPPVGGPVLAGIMAGLTTAFGLAKIALIKAQPLPTLAEGGLLLSRPGGVPFIGAEAGYDEYVVPFKGDAVERLAAAIAAKIPEGLYRYAASSRTPETTIVPEPSAPGNLFHVIVNLGSETLYDDIQQATANGLLLIHSGSVKKLN